MDRLWAPWRMNYISRKAGKKCVFCIGKKSALRDKKRYILKRTRYSFSLLNLYPYNNAHVMVAPLRHVKNLELLKDEELMDLMKLVVHTKKKIEKALKPAGFNIGINIGRVAGAGFPGHVHVHIVPRWTGDTNFMPVTANMKMISWSLEAMRKLLKD